MMSLCIQLDCQFSQLPDSVMLSLAACHPGDQGSNIIFLNIFCYKTGSTSFRECLFISCRKGSLPLEHILNTFQHIAKSFIFVIQWGDGPGEVRWGPPFALYNTRPRHRLLNPPYLHATNTQLRLWEIVQHPLTMTSKDERSASVSVIYFTINFVQSTVKDKYKIMLSCNSTLITLAVDCGQGPNTGYFFLPFLQ